MRKFFALALAVAMVLSLASVSFAANTTFDPTTANSYIAISEFHKYGADGDSLDDENDTHLEYGKAHYAMLYEGQWEVDDQGTTSVADDTANIVYRPMTKYDQVEKLKIKTDFEMGEDLVESVSIVKKSLKADRTYGPNPEYVVNKDLDINGSSWMDPDNHLNGYQLNAWYQITDGVTTLPKSELSVTREATGDDGVIDMYDLFKVDSSVSITGTGAFDDPYVVTVVALHGDDLADVVDDPIEDEADGIVNEVIAVSDPKGAKSDRTGANNAWTDPVDDDYEVYAPGTGYFYFIEVKSKKERVTGDADVIGTFEFSRKADTKDGIAKIEKDDNEIDFAFNLFYENNYIDDSANLKIVSQDSVTLKWDDIYVLKFDNDDEIDVEFGKEDGNEGTFTVDVSGQGKLAIDYSTQANEAICDANPGVKMFFVNFNGAKFNRTGSFEYEMDGLVAAYQVIDDQLVAINGLEISSDTATFNTRTLGNYVFADAELVNPTPAVAEAPAVEAPAVTNPSTGAAA